MVLKVLTRKAFFLVILLVCAVELQAQSFKTVSLLGSYTVPNSEEWDYIKDHSVGIDVAAAWKQQWGWQDKEGVFHPLRRTYDMGVRLNFTYFPNDIAGQRIGLCGFISEPVLDFWNSSLRFEMDFGLAWYTNPYRRTPNPQNVFIGSYTNCLIELGPSFRHYFSNGTAIVLAGKFVHSSNGYLKKPNKGLNYLQAELGYSFHNDRARTFQHQYLCDTQYFSGGQLLMSFSDGYVQPRFVEAKKRYYHANTVRFGWLYDLSPARSVGANIDFTYNRSHEELNAFYGDYDLPFYVGLAGFYEAHWQRLTLHTALAFYLLRSIHGTTPMYERVGLFYNFGNPNSAMRQFVGVSLKSHMAHIDFIEFHFGVKIRGSYLR